MSSVQFLNDLSDSHSADLQGISPTLKDIVICPICFCGYGRDAIGFRSLTDGHIWPKRIGNRDPSGKARQQHVLLCSSCNHKAGGRSDGQMQLIEDMSAGHQRGSFTNERRIQIVRGPSEKPIELRGEVVTDSIDKDTHVVEATMHFAVKRGSSTWRRNNPESQKQFQELAEQGAMFSALVFPPAHVNARVAEAGWISAAYLLAYYALGYRYVLNIILEPVRRYLMTAIHGDDNSLPDLSTVPGVSIANRTESVAQPKIELVFPLNPSSEVHLKVSFLRREITLPFQYSDNLSKLIHYQFPNISQLISDSNNHGSELMAVISCTKTVKHTCIWDYLCLYEDPVKTT